MYVYIYVYLYIMYIQTYIYMYLFICIFIYAHISQGLGIFPPEMEATQRQDPDSAGLRGSPEAGALGRYHRRAYGRFQKVGT